jgi:ketosteroid isomerase-like protein
MKRKFALILTIISLFSAAAFAQKAGAKATPKADPAKEVLAAFETLIEGIREGDVDKTAGVYDKTDRVLLFNYNGTATIGWDNMRSNREQIYAKTKNVTLETTGVRVELLSATSAYVSCKWKQTQDNEGTMETSTGRMTLVFRKIGKDWKIVHSHTSPDKVSDVEIIEQAPPQNDDRDRIVVGDKP